MQTEESRSAENTHVLSKLGAGIGLGTAPWCWGLSCKPRLGGGLIEVGRLGSTNHLHRPVERVFKRRKRRQNSKIQPGMDETANKGLFFTNGISCPADNKPHLAPQSRHGSPLQQVVAGAVVCLFVESVGVRAIGLAKCRGVEIGQKQQRSKGNNKAGEDSIRESRRGPRRLPPTHHVSIPSVFCAQSFA